MWGKICAAGKRIRDIFFPVFCVECSAENEWWCARCRQAHGEHSVIIRENFSHLDKVVALFRYHDHLPIARLIHLFKYRYAFGVAELWQEVFRERWPQLEAVWGSGPVVFVPVPLHPRRERERGFNQALLIAKALRSALLEKTGMVHQVSSGELVRCRNTKQQATLAGSERAENMQEAFVWRGKGTVPEMVVLVDDVCTTGATLEACATALRRAGVKQVMAMVLAVAG